MGAGTGGRTGVKFPGGRADDPTMVPFLHEVAVVTHVGAFTTAAAAVLTTDLNVGRAIRSGRLRPGDVDRARGASRVIWASLAVIVVSGAVLIATGGPVGGRLVAKIVMVVVAVTNGVTVHRRVLPALGEVAAGAPADPVLMWRAGASAGLSAACWWSAYLTGAVRSVDLPVLTLLGLFTVVATWAAALGGGLAVRLARGSGLVGSGAVGPAPGARPGPDSGRRRPVRAPAAP